MATQKRTKKTPSKKTLPRKKMKKTKGGIVVVGGKPAEFRPAEFKTSSRTLTRW